MGNPQQCLYNPTYHQQINFFFNILADLPENTFVTIVFLSLLLIKAYLLTLERLLSLHVKNMVPT